MKLAHILDEGTAEQTNQADVKEQAKIKTPVADTGLDKDKGGGAETKTERTYRQSEVDALLGKAGQKLKADNVALATERDSLKTEVKTLKTQYDALTTEIKEARDSIASLTKDMEALSADDPQKYDLAKIIKERQAELKVAKDERAEIAESKAELTQWKRDQLVFSVADDYVKADGSPVDFDAFKASADKFKLSGREELEELAIEKGFKPKSEASEPDEEPPDTPPVHIDSGNTRGGADQLRGDAALEAGLAEERKKLGL